MQRLDDERFRKYDSPIREHTLDFLRRLTTSLQRTGQDANCGSRRQMLEEIPPELSCLGAAPHAEREVGHADIYFFTCALLRHPVPDQIDPSHVTPSSVPLCHEDP